MVQQGCVKSEDRQKMEMKAKGLSSDISRNVHRLGATAEEFSPDHSEENSSNVQISPSTKEDILGGPRQRRKIIAFTVMALIVAFILELVFNFSGWIRFVELVNESGNGSGDKAGCECCLGENKGTSEKVTPRIQDDSRQIPGRMQPGLVITFEGSIPCDAQEFSLNLSNTPKLFDGDIALHVAVRFASGTVARNSFEKGSWKLEEESGEPPLILQKGSHFTCTIKSFKDKFQLDFNGQYFFDFIHRIPQEGMKHVIARDVKVSEVKFSYTV